MACTEKRKKYAREWYHANRERILVKKREYSKRTSAKNCERVRKWAENNRDRIRANRRKTWRNSYRPEVRAAWNEKNKERLKSQARMRYKNNDKYRIDGLLKQARRRRAMCSWANKDMIRAFYQEAQNKTRTTGIKHVVDHIVPIKHPLVSGLHNEFNLRVITSLENAKKKNKFEVQA